MIFQSIKMAGNSIASNKMCSFLTMLGIIIGVASLIVLVSIATERFENDEDAFTIVNQSAVMETMESVTNTLAWKAAENIRSTHCVILVDQTGKTLYNKITKGFVVK